jgi:hypothetical protein
VGSDSKDAKDTQYNNNCNNFEHYRQLPPIGLFGINATCDFGKTYLIISVSNKLVNSSSPFPSRSCNLI